jgi:hypothetical protein
VKGQILFIESPKRCNYMMKLRIQIEYNLCIPVIASPPVEPISGDDSNP